MTTVLDVIKGALKDIEVLASGESPTAEESTDVLEKLNQMVAGWELDSISIGAPTWTTATTIPLPENHVMAIRHNLAVNVAPMFGRQVSSIIAQGASDGYRSLQNAYGGPVEMDMDTALAPRSRFLTGRPV